MAPVFLSQSCSVVDAKPDTFLHPNENRNENHTDTLRYWLKKLAPIFYPIRIQQFETRSHAFSRALRRLHEIISSSDWFNSLYCLRPL